MRKVVNYNAILKRSRCLNSVMTESTLLDSTKIFNDLNQSIDSGMNSRNAETQRLLRSYIESLCCVDGASTSYNKVFKLLEKFNDLDPVISDRILREYVDRILPYTENVNVVIESLDRYDLTEAQESTIYNSCMSYSVADRILNNHEKISKRFNIEKEANRVKSVGLKYFIDSCGDMIDTYKIKNYQKMNLLFEEAYYLLEKNHIEYDMDKMLTHVVEYYLIQNPYVTERELMNYRRAIDENYILEDEQVAVVQSLLAPETDPNEPYRSINDAIRRFLVDCNKTESSLPIMIDRLMSNNTKEDTIFNIDNLVYLLWSFVNNKTFDSDEVVYTSFRNLISHITNATCASNNPDCGDKAYTKEDIVEIINRLGVVKKSIELTGNSNPQCSSAAISFIKNAINPGIEALSDTRDLLYSKSNIDNMNFVNSESVTLPLQEFKIFKFHNLVNAAFNLDKFLKVKEKRFLTKTNNKVKNFVKKTKHILFGEMSEFKDNIHSYIGEDCKASICIRQYPYNESELNEVVSFLEVVCNEFNDLLTSQNMNTMRAYYIINPGVAEVNIKESTVVELSESDAKLVADTFDNSIDLYLETFYETSGHISLFENFILTPIEEQVLDFSKYNNFTFDHFTLALEAMSYLNIDSDIVKVFGEKFSDYQFNKAIEEGVINESYTGLSRQERKVSEYVSNWTREEDVPSDIQLEAYGYLINIIEDATNEENKEEDHSKYDPKKYGDKKPGININNIKLGLIGIKNKFKEMNTKQKEISRNLDNSVRSLVTGMKHALVSDRREQIIKGSVIPSFSRCIKASIGLCILGVLTNGITIPVIVAMGGLAMSKKLSDRERALILDEIETELEVLEKEISNAENNNDIKKYRALLHYKKELQRQYQRIRYNLKFKGGSVLPSSAGLNKED